ncbi:hypothetical protein NUW58_g181 [Xylaria curta]|uniref:Uncharacterized protein n=1 Tax=Xylaria curta TaxID=42375 RepID=A0ACC1PSQ3_9PEZI|nr:hypothetical protein NUW58_g181 [Xylaria curta]
MRSSLERRPGPTSEPIRISPHNDEFDHQQVDDARDPNESGGAGRNNNEQHTYLNESQVNHIYEWLDGIDDAGLNDPNEPINADDRGSSDGGSSNDNSDNNNSDDNNSDDNNSDDNNSDDNNSDDDKSSDNKSSDDEPSDDESSSDKSSSDDSSSDKSSSNDSSNDDSSDDDANGNAGGMTGQQASQGPSRQLIIDMAREEIKRNIQIIRDNTAWRAIDLETAYYLKGLIQNLGLPDDNPAEPRPLWL